MKHKNNLLALEAVMFGQAGLLAGAFKDNYPKELKKEYQFYKKKYKLKPLNAYQWKFMRMRPGNFPTIRIAQLIQLLYCRTDIFSTLLSLETFQEAYKFFSIQASSYWDSHFHFDKTSPVKKKKLNLKIRFR